MNREIKFRIWYRKSMSFPHIQDTFIGRGNQISMQYTGLKDMNGVEIYEGDIIRYKYNNIHQAWWRDLEHKKEIINHVEKEKSIFYEKIKIVNNEKFKFTLGYPNLFDNYEFPGYFEKIEENSSGDTISIYKDFEVIGNIYENKELLK